MMFSGLHSHVVIGSLGNNNFVMMCLFLKNLSGIADTLAYSFLSLFNKLIMSNEDDIDMFLTLFSTLTFSSIVAAWFSSRVRSIPDDENVSAELKN